MSRHIHGWLRMSYLEDRIEGLMRSCIGCGECTRHCPSARHGGCDPHLIMTTGEGNVLDCIACGTCSRICDDTDPLTVMKTLIYLRRGGEFPDHFERTGYIHPMEDCPSRKELEPKWDDDGINIMPGCVVKAKVPFLEYATYVALRAIGFECKELDGNGCCLRPVQFMGMASEDMFEYRSRMMDNALGRPVLALCHGCSEGMNSSSLGVGNIINFLHENRHGLPKLARGIRVAIEPGCQAEELFNEMREVVTTMGCTVTNDTMGCCGKDTGVSTSLMEERIAECSGADFIITACPKCFTKYDALVGGKPTLHLMELVAVAAGDARSLEYHRIPVVL